MRHGSVRRQMSAYLDGDLSPAAVARLERHLATCGECRGELASLRRVVDWLHELPSEEPSPALAQSVFARIEAEGASSSRFVPAIRRWLETGWTAPLAAAAAGLLALAWVQGVPQGLGLFGPSGDGSAVVAAAPEGAVVPQVDANTPAAALPQAGAVADSTTLPVVDASSAPAGVTPPMASSADAGDAQAVGLPPLSSCFDPARPPMQACARWQAWMLGLALRDPQAFAAQLDAVPTNARETWIGQLSRIAADSGSAPLMAEQLRASHDPRLSSLAVRLERTVLPVASSADLPPQH